MAFYNLIVFAYKLDFKKNGLNIHFYVEKPQLFDKTILKSGKTTQVPKIGIISKNAVFEVVSQTFSGSTYF